MYTELSNKDLNQKMGLSKNSNPEVSGTVQALKG